MPWSPTDRVGGTCSISGGTRRSTSACARRVIKKGTAIRRIDDTASADTLFAFIPRLESAAFCEGG